MAPKKKVTPQKKLSPTIQKPEEVLTPPPDPDLIQVKEALHQEARNYFDQEADHYGYPAEVPERLQAKMDAIRGATDKDDAYRLLKKAKDSIQTTILAAWANKKIPGPLTEDSLEKKIKKAENLAQMLEKKGQLDAAETQWARASKLRGQLEEVKEESRG